MVFSILKFWVEKLGGFFGVIEWINPQFNFSGQYLGLEQKVFKWDEKVNQDMVPKLFP